MNPASARRALRRRASSPSIAHRASLASAAAVFAVAWLAWAQPVPPAARPQSSFVVRRWDFAHTPAGPLRANALVPRSRRAGERFPLLIALHGLGEARRGLVRGTDAWVLDYEIGASDLALRHGLASLDDVFGLAAPARWATLRASIRREPYAGLVVVTPYTPDVLHDVGGARHVAYDAWLAGALIERARRELPVDPRREATGIDGVSLGGLHALWTGLGHPDVFGVVGALQPAVRHREELVMARIAPGARRPSQRVRLVTSDHDVLRADVLSLDAQMTAAHFAHELRELRGPHDYVFNRGPGGVEMLRFHDRALRARPAP